MDGSEEATRERPLTALEPPPVDCGDEELLVHVLEVELGRLFVAQQIEIDRQTVFPETSVIIRDILKLHEALRRVRNGVEDGEEVRDKISGESAVLEKLTQEGL